MDDWSLNSLAFIFGTLALPAVLGGAALPAHPLAPDFPSAQASALVNAEARVEWVLRAKDLASCVTAAPNIRRILHTHGSRVQVIVFAVETDTALVRSFMRRERLFRVDVRRISERELAREFGRRVPDPEVTPFLVMSPVRPGQSAFGNTKLTGDRQGSASLVSQLETYFRSIAVQHHTPHPSIAAGGGE